MIQVALKRFIDDIANDAIEAKLISPFGGIFTPVAVSAMSDDSMTSMAGESEENRAQREQLTKQLDVLTKGSDTCKRFIGIRLLGKADPCLFYFNGCSQYWKMQIKVEHHPIRVSATTPIVGLKVLSRETLDWRQMNW